MNNYILHITPHFEPSKCGVSDYVRQFQKQVEVNDGFFVAALHDKFIRGIETMPEGVRIGFDQPVPVKIQTLTLLLKSQPFKKVVFHYVPHGYHSKGLPVWLNKLAPLLNELGVPLIIILHELWSGGTHKNLKVRLLGSIQRQFLLRWLRKLNEPTLITTSAYTAFQLGKHGFIVSSNPVFNNLEESEIREDVQGLLQDQGEENEYLSVILFGSVPPDAPPAETARFISMLAASEEKRVRVMHVGYGNNQEYWETLKGLTPDTVIFEILGPLPAGRINALMRKSQWGLSTYPYELWSKSGSIAAMLANGLPVMVMGSFSKGKKSKKISLPAGLFVWDYLSESDKFSLMTDYPVMFPPVHYNKQIMTRLSALIGLEATEKMQESAVSVLITVYHCWPQALKCVQKLMAIAEKDQIMEILIIHDAPDDIIPHEITGNSLVRLVQNDKNIGYVASVNKGMNLAKNESVLLLDADAYMQDSIAPAKGLLETDPNIVLVAPAAFLSNGQPVRRLYPSPGKSSLLFGQKWEAAFEKRNSGLQVVSHSYAWLIRRDVFLALGGFDPYFNFIEADVEFCMRVQDAYPGGIQICHGTHVIHEGGANPIRRNERVLEWYRSRWYMMRKYEPGVWGWLMKSGIATRVLIEQWSAAVFQKIRPGQKDYWEQKFLGRKALLSDMQHWK